LAGSRWAAVGLSEIAPGRELPDSHAAREDVRTEIAFTADKARELVAREGYDPQFGARPLTHS